jgi:uncharacterized membrane protein YvbJ
MPLITCPDCQKEVSDSAPTCIHCGRVNRQVNKKSQETVTIQKTSKDLKQWKSLFVGLMIISVAMMYMGWGQVATVLFGGSFLGWAFVRHLIYYNHK